MELKSYQYIRKYIRDNYPMYAENLEHSDFYSFILNSIYKEYGATAIKNGEADKAIDSLVDQYAKNNMEPIRLEYSQLCAYIKKLVLTEKSFLKNPINVGALDDIVRYIALQIVDKKDIASVNYIDGAMDQSILDLFRESSYTLYNDVKTHVKDLLLFRRFSGYSEPTYNYLVGGVVGRILSTRNVNDILKGKFNNEILQMYSSVEQGTKRHVSDYIKKLFSDVDFSLGISLNEIVKLVNEKIFSKGEFSVGKILNGEMDDYLRDYVDKLKKSSEFEAAKDYVFERIQNYDSITFSSSELVEIRNKILDTLIEEYKFSIKDIASGKYDDVIIRLFNKESMFRSSVKRDDVPSEIKHNTVKKTVNRVLISLMVIFVLVPCLYLSSIFIKNTVVDPIRYEAAYSEVMEFDGYDYTYIYSRDNEHVEFTGSNAATFWYKVNNMNLDNENYRYLGFYNAYMHVAQDKLYVMDEILREARASVHDAPVFAEVYEDLSGYSCFLEFAMQRLREMGCEEINAQKYADALEAYKSVESTEDTKIPMNLLSKKHVSAIEEIMEMYREYNEDLVVDFSEALAYNQENNSRRSV